MIDDEEIIETLGLILSCGYEKKLVAKLSALADSISDKVAALESETLKLSDAKDIIEESFCSE